MREVHWIGSGLHEWAPAAVWSDATGVALCVRGHLSCTEVCAVTRGACGRVVPWPRGSSFGSRTHPGTWQESPLMEQLAKWVGQVEPS